MNAKQFLLATLAGGLTLFVVGGALYGWLLADFFESSVMRETPIWWALVASEFVLAALVTLIFGRWATISTPVGGLKAGAVIGLLLGAAMNLAWYAVTTMIDPTVGAVDVVVSVVRMAVAGAVIGLVLGKTA